MLAPHLGLLWEKFRQEYPSCKEVDPLVPVVETFSGAERSDVDLTVPYLPRIWFVSRDGNAIVQVQRDRLLHNWRKIHPTDEYPRYSVVKEKFSKRFAEFEAFLLENQLGTVSPIQFEMTYLNHIPVGSGWETFMELGKVFPDFNWRTSERFLPLPEKVNWRTSFAMPDNIGRLHLSIQNGLRRQDKLPVFVVDLTVRGIGQERSTKDMWNWFNVAREWIVRGFADITGGELHSNVWKRQA
jgi:uncharacterized protein (TIGR04255 family)